MPEFLSAARALRPIQSGQRIFVGSGAAEPQLLVNALAERAGSLCDAEVVHLMTLGAAPYSDARFAGHLRHNALFIGSNVRGAVASGLADYTPCFLSEIPSLMRAGRLPLDAALIQVAPPEGGYCSLGVSVDVAKAAVESARYVVAQVNPRMPWTLGDSFVRVEDIDAFVEGPEDLLELPHEDATAASLWIGRFVERLVRDGDTLQLGIGAIPDAVLEALRGKKDLGVHSEMISDGVLDLWRRGVVTGKRKSVHPGKIVASFALGSRELYAALDKNPVFELRPSDQVNDPRLASQNDGLVAVNSALQVDLTGQVCADSIGPRFYSGVGGQVDFIRAAAWSKGGRSIIALPATAKDGALSRIVPTLIEGSGVVTTRADVDFVVTEYGIASLKGRTVRERAVALIQVAHPAHRRELFERAKSLGFLDADYRLPLNARPYRSDLEATVEFPRGRMFFRPLKPTDLRRLKELFYSQSAETTYLRFGAALSRLSEAEFQELVAIDYRGAVAVGGFVKDGTRERLAAVGRYALEPGSRWAECAFSVHDDYQGQGVGTFLLDYLSWIAKESGLEGFTAEVLSVNRAMRRCFEKRFRVMEEGPVPGGTRLTLRLSDWKGSGSPARAADHSLRG